MLRMKISGHAAVLAVTSLAVASLAVASWSVASAPAFAQEFDYGYGPHQRYLDELSTPLELDGLELGRDAPFLSTQDLEPSVRPPAGSFELEAPPIGSRLFR